MRVYVPFPTGRENDIFHETFVRPPWASFSSEAVSGPFSFFHLSVGDLTRVPPTIREGKRE